MHSTLKRRLYVVGGTGGSVRGGHLPRSIRSWRLVSPGPPGKRGIEAGSDDDVKDALDATDRAGRLRWKRFVPNHDDAQALPDGALAGLSLLCDRPDYVHSRPTKVVEYMDHGFSVTTTQTPVAVQIVGEHRCGIVVPFDDPSAVAAAAEGLRRDVAERKAMGERGHVVALAHFDWTLTVVQAESWLLRSASIVGESATGEVGEVLAANPHAAVASKVDDAPSAGLRRLGTKAPLRVDLRDAWRRRDFALVVPPGDLRAPHMDTFFGQVWHLLNPSLLVGVYFLVFGVILRTDRGVELFAFLTIGILTFQYTKRCAIDGASTVSSSEGLLRSIQFPRVLLPVSALVFESAAYLPAVMLMLVVAVLSGVTPELSWMLLVPVPVLLLQVTLNLGIVFVVARPADRYRDIRQVLPFLFRILLCLSGILFSVDRYVAGCRGRQLFALDPVYSLIYLGRSAILGTPVRETMWVSAIAWSALFFVGGLVFFRAAEERYGRG